MSWGLASLLLLSVALAAGFVWYERTSPSPRLLSVVGTLAALAIIGRIAFAPLPNVKPTTDIVLIAGYALGGAPGFAVGAVAALGSNLFFGQGPWTPWQMGAWGLIGIIGAALARISHGRLGRVPLAIACALSGLLFGAILDLSTWLTFSSHTLGELAATASLAIPFDVAHAVGNLVFFLAFGPVLIRAVQRCRTRFEIRWQPIAPVVLVLLVAGAGLAAAPRAQAATPIARGIAYLQQARNADGGWGGAPGQASNGLHTAWSVFALAAAGQPVDARDVLIRRLGASRESGDVMRTILALRATGADPRDAGGRDLVAELLARERPDGSIAGSTGFTASAVLALVAAGERKGIARAAAWIAGQANRDGGFSAFRRGVASNADDTGFALQALVAAGRRRTPAVRRAAAYLRRVQQPDGGFALSHGAPTNAQSTAFAVLGLSAAGVDPARVRRAGRSPIAYLQRLQSRDGSFRYSRASSQTPVWVTAQVLLALQRRPLPVRAPAPPATARAAPDRTGDRLGVVVAALLTASH